MADGQFLKFWRVFNPPNLISVKINTLKVGKGKLNLYKPLQAKDNVFSEGTFAITRDAQLSFP